MTEKTPEERRAAKRAATRKNREAYFFKEVRDARNGRERVQHVCRFAKAVGDDLDDERRTELARELAEVVTRWNAE